MTICDGSEKRKENIIQTNPKDALSVCIYPNSTCFERSFRSSSGFYDLLYSAALYKTCKRVLRSEPVPTVRPSI